LLLSWAIFGAGVEWSSGDHRCSVEEWAREVVDILVDGAARVVTIPAEEPRLQQGKGGGRLAHQFGAHDAAAVISGTAEVGSKLGARGDG
jgi:hypothetical protein